MSNFARLFPGMSWWWSKNEARPESSTAKQAPDASPTVDQPAQHKSERRHLSRDEQSDQDLLAFLKELQTEHKAGTPSLPKHISDPTAQGPPEDISPDSLYPTEMHCRSALDYAMFCQSLGGQFVNVYRFGTFRSCSNHWQDFWLCMRTRKWEEQARVQAIQDHYRKKAIKYKTGPSSEDVWEVRTEPFRGAFQGDLEALERQIRDWEEGNLNTSNPWVKIAEKIGRG